MPYKIIKSKKYNVGNRLNMRLRDHVSNKLINQINLKFKLQDEIEILNDVSIEVYELIYTQTRSYVK